MLTYFYNTIVQTKKKNNKHEVIRIIDFNLPTSNRRNVLSEFVLISFHFNIGCVRLLRWEKNRYNTTEISRWSKIDNTEPRSFLYWMNIENRPLCTWINTTHWKWKPFSLYRFGKGLRPILQKPFLWMAIFALFPSPCRL